MPRGPESGGLRGPFDELESGGFPDHVEEPRKKRRGGSRREEELEGGVEMIGKKRAPAEAVREIRTKRVENLLQTVNLTAIEG